jgi:hypothetical protein
MIKVEGYPNLYRDERTGAIVNCDTLAYNNYVISLNKRDLQKKQLDEMRNDINEIKSILRELLNGSK